jgi:hypothetical protein
MATAASCQHRIIDRGLPHFLTAVPITVTKGRPASLDVEFSPSIRCSASLTSGGKAIAATGLETKKTDSKGLVSWVWTVDPSTTADSGTLTVACERWSTQVHVLIK